MLDNYEKYCKLNESGYARIANILRGLVPSVLTVGIITWENPYGKEETKKYNKEANERLERILKDGQYGYTKIKGKYGQIENSFLIRNISIKELLSLSKDGDKEQESVIFGERIEKDNFFGMNFKLISTLKESFGKVLSEKNVFINRNNSTEFYSEYKGRKFLIPFFDVDISREEKEEYIKNNSEHLPEIVKDLELKPEEINNITSGNIQSLNDKTIDIVYIKLLIMFNTGEKFVDYSKAKWEGGKIVGHEKRVKSEVSENLTQEEIDELNELQAKAINQVGFSAWVTRGRIRNLLNKK